MTDFAKTPKLRTTQSMSQFTPHQSPSKPALPPPLAPPPPTMNWRPIAVQRILPSSPQATQPKQPTHQMQMANNHFMEELLKAFQTFNVDSDKQFGNHQSDKRPP